MDEQTFEEIICKYPELIEGNLSFKGRQVIIKGKWVDVLLEDRYGQKLIVELKKGAVRREHVAQLLDYEGYFVSPVDPNVRVMLVGNRVPENLRRSLDHHGFEWKEFPIAFLIDYLRRKGDLELVSRLTSADALTQDIPRRKSYPSDTNVQTSSFVPVQPNIQNEGENMPIDMLLGSVSCEKFRAEQLPHKINREQLAWKLIQENKGKYTEQILNSVFDIVDTDTRNRRWFGPLLAVPNRNKIFSHSMELINKWIEELLFSGRSPAHSLNICLNDICIRGASKGLATLFLYLSNPELYNIWLPSTEKGLVILGKIQTFRGSDYSSYYTIFNEATISLRNKYQLQPQEMDWVLSFIPAYTKNRDKIDRYY